MMGATLQKVNKVPDNEVSIRAQPRSSEALRPLHVSVHPCARDIGLCSFIVEVVRHCANRHKLRDKGSDVLEWRS